MSERRDRIGALAEADAGALLDDGTVAGRWMLDPAGSRARGTVVARFVRP